MKNVYLIIDLKSFYASVECVERGLDPMTTNLVVADPDRGKGTICLAVSPALKALGVKNRCRVFEIPDSIEYIIAPPRMRRYIDYSANIYEIYLKYIAKEDIHVYSIDEAFMDFTHYLKFYNMKPVGIAKMIMTDILETTGIRATCGIGTNLYLAKIALDIMAKHSPDFIGILTEQRFKSVLWDYKPLTDFWRIGPGIAKHLNRIGIRTMRDITLMDIDVMYREFGIDAELLIDHAWGRESCTIADIKQYQPKSHCLSSGQVLMRDYTFDGARIICQEMTELLCLMLVNQKLITDSITLYVGYSKTVKLRGSRGSVTLATASSSDQVIIPETLKRYDQIVLHNQPIRRVCLSFNHLMPEGYYQCSFFEDPLVHQKNRAIQKTMLSLKQRFGKNAILRGYNYLPDATTRERNHQIGGHKSGE